MKNHILASYKKEIKEINRKNKTDVGLAAGLGGATLVGGGALAFAGLAAAPVAAPAAPCSSGCWSRC